MPIRTLDNSDRLHISLDIEGTLVKIETPFLEDFDQEHGTNYSSIGARTWDFDNMPGITVEKFIEGTKRIWHDEPERMKPIEEGFEEYNKQIDDRHTIDLVTERQECDDKLKTWISDYGLKEGKDYRNYIVTKDKSKMKDEYDVYVDDKPVLDIEKMIVYDRSCNRYKNFPIRILSLAALPPLLNHSEDTVRKLMNSK